MGEEVWQIRDQIDFLEVVLFESELKWPMLLNRMFDTFQK